MINMLVVCERAGECETPESRYCRDPTCDHKHPHEVDQPCAIGYCPRIDMSVECVEYDENEV